MTIEMMYNWNGGLDKFDSRWVEDEFKGINVPVGG